MKREQLARVNSGSFIICMISIVCGVTIGLLGIWGAIATDAMLWRALGTCGVIFIGAVSASLAVRCFKINEWAN